jgi:hypothetical protein
MLLQITESGAHGSNLFTDHHSPRAASKPELPSLQIVPIMVGEYVLGKPCTNMPLPSPDLLTWLRATRPSLLENVIPTPSQTLLMTHPWLDQTPAFAVTTIAPVGGVAPGPVLLNTVPFDGPGATAEGGDFPFAAFGHRAALEIEI